MSRRSFSCLLAVAALWLAGGVGEARGQQPQPPPAGEEDVLYGALVLATKSDHPQPPPEALRAQADNMREIFGYNDFRLLGEKRKAVPTGREDWLVVTRHFILNVDTQKRIAGGYALALKLKEEDRVLVGAEVQLRRDRPLFIRGPLVGDGQLLILLTVVTK